MITRVPGLWLIGLAMMASAQLGCGGKKGLGPDGSTGAPDGSTDAPHGEAPSCVGERLSCVSGGPLGTGVACSDGVISADCTGGQWICPQGTVDTRDCTCGFPGGVTGCTICTPEGWGCFDASVDVGDARKDLGPAPADGAGCGRTNEHATIIVHQPDGSEMSCSHGIDAGPFAATPVVWIGRVTASDATSVTVEACADGADGGCVPGTLRIEAKAPGLDLTRFPKVPVRVRVALSRFYACQQSLEITAPTDPPAFRLLLAVVDGGNVFTGSPYKADRVRLGCSSSLDAGCGSPLPGDYAFDFGSASGADSPLRVYMGETATWTSGGTPFTVRNLRSFQTALCDDYWNWAYTIYAQQN